VHDVFHRKADPLGLLHFLTWCSAYDDALFVPLTLRPNHPFPNPVFLRSCRLTYDKLAY
jgi:hypothetical protein